MMVLGPKYVGAFLMFKFYVCAVIGVIIGIYSSLMMVLGPKHVGAFLMCKFYICAVIGVIIE